MLVKAQYKGHVVTALSVGQRNARRYFARSASSVEFELDHLRITCGLPPQFWDGEAQISDQRLCAWLESKRHPRRSSRGSAVLAMTPCGKNSFKLTVIPAKDAQRRGRTVGGEA